MTETTTLRGALVMSYPSALGPADEPLSVQYAASRSDDGPIIHNFRCDCHSAFARSKRSWPDLRYSVANSPPEIACQRVYDSVVGCRPSRWLGSLRSTYRHQRPNSQAARHWKRCCQRRIN